MEKGEAVDKSRGGSHIQIVVVMGIFITVAVVGLYIDLNSSNDSNLKREFIFKHHKIGDFT